MFILTINSNKTSNITLTSLFFSFHFHLKDLKNKKETTMEKRKQICDFSNRKTDVCEINNGDVRIHANSSTVQFITTFPSETNHSWKIKPHPRKGDKIGMSKITEFTLKSSASFDQALNSCTLIQSIPSIIFSIGGYMGNVFHDFSDILIPLFLTSHHYHGQVQFVITDMKHWWVSKYRNVLNQLTKFPIIDMDKEEGVLCYQNLTIGLRFHLELSIDPLKSPYSFSMQDFASLIRNSYSLKREKAISLNENTRKKPRLMIIARRQSRSFTNIVEIVRMAEDVGFEAVVAECDAKSNLTEFAKKVNSFDVMMGVHGAGLTNFMFLPSNAIVIQVVPLGGLGDVSWMDYGKPSVNMKLRYLQYDISENESTLIEEYPKDHIVIKDPSLIRKQGWLSLREIYLIKQNVKLDVQRFRPVLLKAIELLHY